MPRFILYRFTEQPPQNRPVGMNEIVSMGNHPSPDVAMKSFLKDTNPAKLRMFSSGQPVTHLGLYELSPGYSKEPPLLRTIQISR